MDKIEYRGVIKYLFLKGDTPTQIKAELDSVYGDSAPSFTSVKFRVAEFKRGRKSSGDDEHSGRPNAKITDESIAKVHQMVLYERRIKERMANVFWDSHGVILINYLQKGKIITGAYYASLRYKLKAEFVEKRPHLQRKKILFHQDNTLSHTSAVAMVKIHELWFELLDHLPYSPDLVPSDFFLFPHLKIALIGQRFSSNEEAITFMNNYFAEINAEYYLDGL
ncbi:mariner Mos1 transposase [Trichonephila clavipes]|nr:mariner Mos1 transposase [Trichonephila clavipes]